MHLQDEMIRLFVFQKEALERKTDKEINLNKMKS